ncbi:mitochondrial large subunit ribosomal protein-domain-containing protein [Boeremia exigua]|uniref:mitochondrial large subunit ribosomal protein-domain-containing protein n=1 Tax=Boeremia exigua TaxID=749465 RepID=UPI001E8DF415|nr:mitochondrial large subunit ribosomal protein-domain-containing protein [Boeremia exigua]KAH6637683.1 mitochondrial large subunit ribosomal protein-domain-containing protein [Boeremia exigua]
MSLLRVRAAVCRARCTAPSTASSTVPYAVAAPYTTAAPAAPVAPARAQALAAVEAVTEADSAQPAAADPLPASRSKALKTAARAAKTTPFTPATMPQMPQSPPLYHVARSATRNLPVYTDFKRGGNLHLTTVRKTSGNLHALRDELRAWLAKKEEDVYINPLTGHIVVKGHHKSKVMAFLEDRGM